MMIRGIKILCIDYTVWGRIKKKWKCHLDSVGDFRLSVDQTVWLEYLLNLPQTGISTEWTAVKFCTDIHVLTRIKSLTFPQEFLVKFLNIY